MKHLHVIHGPNLKTLGSREPHLYGHVTLKTIEDTLTEQFVSLVRFDFFQSNHEGSLVDAIEATTADGLIINPGGLSHTSVVLHDAIRAKGLPSVEVHLSNTFRRESFRHPHVTAGASIGVIEGFGIQSYLLGVRAILVYL